uniref:Uncharacterized protein n=1 Tax=Solanum lycopersicum TaxID=4081 RepID=A0A3Q7IYF4_SOLLC
MIVTLWVTS